MEYLLTFDDGSYGLLRHSVLAPEEVARRKYAFPEERKFPLTDRAHVLSAIKFFNYVDPEDEERLAKAILKRMRELGIEEVNVGKSNRFGKYYENGYLQHFGVKGMHWGVWNEETRARRMGGKGRQSGKAGSGLSFKESDADFRKRLKNDGYSKQQIADMSEGRAMLKKVAIAGLAIAGVAAVGLIGYQVAQRYGNRTLKAGTLIQTVHSNSRGIEERVAGPFYASFKKGDNLVYSHTFGRLSKDHLVSKLAAKQDIKMASEATSHKVFKQMLKDNPAVTYTKQKYVVDKSTWMPKLVDEQVTAPFKDYLKDVVRIDPAKASSINAYRKFQSGFGTNTDANRVVGRNLFYDRLKAGGFNAMVDSHNANLRGGFTRCPFIVFGDVKFDLASQTAVNLSGKIANKNKAKAILYSSAHNIMNTPMSKNKAWTNTAIMGAGAAAVLGIQEISIRGRENFIDNYRKEHPGTKKTDAQIGRMYGK